MIWQHTPYTVPLIIAGCFSLFLAVYIRSLKLAQEAQAISFLMLAVGIWSISDGLQFANATLGGQLFWDKFRYFGVVVVPLLWLVFALEYSGRKHWLTPRIVLLLSIIPVSTLLLVWTNGFHRLFWKDYVLEAFGTFLVEKSTHGPWFSVFVSYGYVLMFAGSLLIFEKLINSKSPLYRGQAMALLLFILGPWIGNILHFLGLNPFPHLNVTPLVFVLGNAIFVWGQFQFHLGDLLPVTHAAVIDCVNDGIIVLDSQNRILEINPSAQKIFNLTPAKVIGCVLEEIIPQLAEQLGLRKETMALERDVWVAGNEESRTYNVVLSPVMDKSGRLLSRAIVMRDITERKHAESELQHHKDNLEEIITRRTAELTKTNEQLVSEISERKRIEEALRESEGKYKSIVENTQDVIMLTAADGKIVYLSPACKNVLGYEPEELLGKRPSIFHPDDVPLVEQKLAEALVGKSGSNCEYRIITKAGGVKWLSHSWSPIIRNGQVQLVVSTVRDTTERKLFEEALHRSEERYRTVVDNSLAGILVSQDGILKFVNKRLVELSGYTEQEFVGRSFEQFLHPEDVGILQEAIKRRLSGQCIAGHFQLRGITKDGRTLWMESFGTKIDFQGKEAVLVNFTDITDRKKAEEAVKESEQRYRSLVEEAKDIIYTIDLKTNTISGANGFAEEILGYKRQDIIGRSFLDLTAPEDHESLLEVLKNRFEGAPAMRSYPFRMRKANGDYLFVEQNGALNYDKDGIPISYLGIARDVTERKRMEEELRLSEERYRQILNSSHDVIVVMDDREKILFANESFRKYRKDSLAPLKNMALFTSIHSDDKKVVREWYRRLVNGESFQSAQYRIIDPGGQMRWMESNAGSIQWPGVEKAFVNVARDITERKAAEEALKESEERYRTLVDNLLTAVCVIQDGKFQFVNTRHCEMSGYTREELVGMPFLKGVHPEDREKIKQIVDYRLQDAAPRGQSEFRCITKDGTTAWVETYGSRIQFRGRPALLVNFLNITERKKMEEALRESEQKFRSLVEITSDLVWETNVDGIYTYASPKVKDLLGYTPEEMVGRSSFDFMTSEEVKELYPQMVNTARRKQSFSNVEELHRHKDGHLVVLESSGVPFFDSNGRMLGYRGIDRDVTDRKRADEALRISEERYRSIFEETPDIFYILDLDTLMIIDANKYALETLGYGLNALGKISINGIVHPDDYAQVVLRLQEMALTGRHLSDFSLRFLTAAGKLHHVEQRGVLLYDNGRPKYFLGLAHDVTQRKMQEEMIQKRNEKLAALYEIARTANQSLELDRMLQLVMDVIVHLTRSDAVCIHRYNEAEQALFLQATFGFPADMTSSSSTLRPGNGLHGHVAAAKTPLILHGLPTDSLSPDRPHFSQMGFDAVLIVPLLAREKLLGTLAILRKVGKQPYDSEDLELLTAVANQVVVAMENISLYSQVLQREAHLQSILQTSLDGIAVTSGDQKVVYRNAALSTMFGYTDADDLSSTDTINYFAPESYPILRWLRNTLNRHQQINRIVEFKAMRKDGSFFDAEMRIGFFLENDNRYDVSIIRDVTEKKRIEFQLLQSGKLAAIGELAAGVAHEINNPLSAIDVHTGLIRDILSDENSWQKDRLLKQLERYLTTIEEQVQRCHLVTNNLLTFSRFPESRKEWFDINSLLTKTVQLMTNLSGKKPEIQFLFDQALPEFYGDPHRLEQVFVNLWNNAARAIEDDGSIIISTYMSDSNICIRFSDSGVGIPTEIKDRIFDPFFTTRGEGEGTGLGLSISYFIIKEMKGRLEFDSSPGEGTTFTITLPKRSEKETDGYVS